MAKNLTIELENEDMRALKTAAEDCGLTVEEYTRLTVIAQTQGVGAVYRFQRR